MILSKSWPPENKSYRLFKLCRSGTGGCLFLGRHLNPLVVFLKYSQVWIGTYLWIWSMWRSRCSPHYWNPDSFDCWVVAIAAFLNEGRQHVTQINEISITTFYKSSFILLILFYYFVSLFSFFHTFFVLILHRKYDWKLCNS